MVETEFGLDPDDDGPGTPNFLFWVGIGLICVIVGLVVLSNWPGVSGADPQPLPLPLPTVSPPPVAQTAPEAVGPGLVVGSICPPVTDHHSTLSLSFELINSNGPDLTVVSVTPVLPTGGLHPIGTTTSGGDCARPGTNPAGGLFTFGKVELFTMRFRLPRECPTAYPVQVKVVVRDGKLTLSKVAVLYDDLGKISFTTCPTSTF